MIRLNESIHEKCLERHLACSNFYVSVCWINSLPHFFREEMESQKWSAIYLVGWDPQFLLYYQGLSVNYGGQLTLSLASCCPMNILIFNIFFDWDKLVGNDAGHISGFTKWIYISKTKGPNLRSNINFYVQRGKVCWNSYNH